MSGSDCQYFFQRKDVRFAPQFVRLFFRVHFSAYTATRYLPSLRVDLVFRPKEYLDAAVAYLEGEESQLNVEDIKGIWVASDDDRVVEIIKALAPSYLPNVDNSTIYWASGGVEGGPELGRMATRTDKAVSPKGYAV